MADSSAGQPATQAPAPAPAPTPAPVIDQIHPNNQATHTSVNANTSRPRAAAPPLPNTTKGAKPEEDTSEAVAAARRAKKQKWRMQMTKASMMDIDAPSSSASASVSASTGSNISAAATASPSVNTSVGTGVGASVSTDDLEGVKVVGNQDDLFSMRFVTADIRMSAGKGQLDGPVASEASSGPPDKTKSVSASASAMPPRPSVPALLTSDIVARFTTFLNHHPLARFLQLSWYDSFFHTVPQLLGENLALDEAALCLATTGSAPMACAVASPESSQHYVRALRHLRTMLLDHEHSRSAATLCATALLQAYELVATPNHTLWIQHAGGASRLIESRGPRAHRAGMSRAILESMRGNIIISAINMRKKCFLAEKQWVDTLCDEHTPYYPDVNESKRARNMTRRHQLHLMMAYAANAVADTPSFVEYYLRTRCPEPQDDEAVHPTNTPMAHIVEDERVLLDALLHRILIIRRSLSSWRLLYFGTLGFMDPLLLAQEERKPGSAVSGKSTRRGPIYADHVSASLDCVANCLVVTLNCLLTSLRPLFLNIPAGRPAPTSTYIAAQPGRSEAFRVPDLLAFAPQPLPRIPEMAARAPELTGIPNAQTQTHSLHNGLVAPPEPLPYPSSHELELQTSICNDVVRRSHAFVKSHSPSSAKWVEHGLRAAFTAAYEWTSPEGKTMFAPTEELWVQLTAS